MEFSLADRTVRLSVGEFANFALGPHESGGGPSGLWRAQLGQHWHNELQKRTRAEAPAAQFEVVIDGRLTHRGWTFILNGRIDQLVGNTLREIKSVTRPLPADEAGLRADYPPYFLQLAAYAVLRRTFAGRRHGQTPGWQQPATVPTSQIKAELVFVEAGSGLAQTIALTPFDEALVYHQLDALVEFLNLRQRATERRRSLVFRPAFESLRAGQETIQADLSSVFRPPSSVVFFEAPTGYGKTGCVLEFALGQLRAGRFARLVWLTLGDRGSLLLDESGSAWRLTLDPPRLVSAVGCGDALLGGLAAGLARGLALLDAARLGVAAAADKLGRAHPGLVESEGVIALLPRVVVESLSAADPRVLHANHKEEP